MKKFALIVAGGVGKRMGSTVPKQFMMLADRPVLMHTIDAFFTFDPAISIIVVLPDHQVEVWNNLVTTFNFDINHQVTIGGESRFESVKNGLSRIDQEGLVAIHDGVRPLVSTEVIGRTFKLAEKRGNAIPKVPIKDSLRSLSGDRNRSVDRSHYVAVQTPQVFELSLVKNAYDKAVGDGFADDASVLDNYGEQIHLCDGDESNIKVTTKFDLVFAASLLKGV